MSRDSRIGKDLSAGGRTSRELDAMTARTDSTAKFTEPDERRKAWKDAWTQSALPQVPNIPGWHLCWLSTTNTYDSIDKRMRLGYVPVKAEEVGNTMDSYHIKAGEHVGFVGCNEMLLFKIPEEMYQDVMAYFHHEAPSDEAQKLRIRTEMLQGAPTKDSAGRRLAHTEGEGLESLDTPRPVPTFQ